MKSAARRYCEFISQAGKDRKVTLDNGRIKNFQKSKSCEKIYLQAREGILLTRVAIQTHHRTSNRIRAHSRRRYEMTL